jgi:hypothetical protein
VRTSVQAVRTSVLAVDTALERTPVMGDLEALQMAQRFDSIVGT